MESEHSITSKYLDDVPQEKIEQSSFCIHGKIAKAIAEEISTGEPCGIAIVGKWGSGKTTVLNYLTDLLHDSHLIFTFDTWSHGRDTLRKSFLLSLGDEVLSGDDAKKKSWKKVRKLIEGTETIETKMEQPQFTPVAAGFISFAFFYALFFGILTLFEEVLPLPPAALAIGIAALLMLLCVLFLMRARKKRHKDFLTDDDNEQAVIESFLSYALGKPSLAYQQVVKKTPEIDSVAFVDFFTQIMSKAKATGTSVVIAIDNLDRLSIKDRENVWEAMQIFLGPEISGDARPWVILPYSTELYTDRGESEDYGKVSGTISKLFIRQFDLPEPIVSDWKECFLDLLNEAFPSIEHYHAITVFAIADNSGTPRVYRTPREAKRFINDMVSVSRIHGSIELSSIALFCQMKDRYYSGSSVEGSLTEFMSNAISMQDKISNLLISKHFDDVEKCVSELAMITFGVFTAEKAEEVYLTYEIDRAISSDHAIPISKLVNNKPGAWTTIYDQIFNKAKQIADLDLNSTKWLSETLHEIIGYSANTDNEKVEKTKVTKLLCANMHLCDWPAHEGCASELTRALEENPVDDATAHHIYEHIISSLGVIVNKSTGDTTGLDSSQLTFWLAETSTVIDYLTQNNVIPERIELPKFGSNYGQLLECLYRHELTDDKYRWLAITTENDSESYYAAMTTFFDLLNEDGVSNLLWKTISLLPTITEVTINDDYDYSSRTGFSIATDQEALDAYYACWQLAHFGKIDCDKVLSFMDSFVLQPSFINTVNQNLNNLSEIQTTILVDLALEKTGSDWANVLARILSSAELNAAVVGEHYSIAFGEQTTARLFEHHANELTWSLAKPIFHEVFSPNDLITQPIKLCLEMIELSEDRETMKNHGRFLEENNRGADIATTSFKEGLIPVYRGVEMVADPESTFTRWLIGELKKILEKQWREVLRKSGSSYEIDLALSICRHPSHDLPEALKSAVKGALLGGSFRADQMSRLIAKIGIDEVSDCLYRSFSPDHTRWKVVVEQTGQTLIELDWIDTISSAQRFSVLQTVVFSGQASGSKWLANSLKKNDRARIRLEGHLQKTRELLKHRLELKAPTKGAKVAWEEILKEIS